jgi:hypothetical protein
MNRMRAEKEAASRNSDKAMTKGGLSYSARQSICDPDSWAVVTHRNGKSIKWQYYD